MLRVKEIFDIMKQAKKYGLLIMVHAENGIIIEDIIKLSLSKNYTHPIYHAFSRPPILEDEAIYRVISYATLLDIPIYIVHVSSFDGLKVIQNAREGKRNIFEGTCS